MTTLPTPGAILAGRYRIERTLGQGGMGAVFAARDLKGDAEVAVKVIKPGLDDDGELVARFRREGALARLASPHIARIHDAGEDDGLLYIVMDLLRGETLKARLAFGNALPVVESLKVGRDIARALAAAHAHAIVHRDVKPANIMLVPERGGVRAVLLDFGIARSLTPGSTMTSTGMVIGTPGYIAPEVSLGGRSYDVRADLYALGVVLYECLAGAPPFVAANALALALRQANEDPVPPGRREDGIPAAVDAVVMRLMSRNPAERPADAQSVIAQLEALSVGSAVDDVTLDAGDPVVESTPHVALAYDPLARVVRFTRTPVPYPTAEDVGHTFGLMRDAFPVDIRGDKGLLIDVRAAPARNDPRFEKILAVEIADLYRGWRRVATLVATDGGVAQVQALRKKANTNGGTFVDEDAALAFLLGAGD